MLIKFQLLKKYLFVKSRAGRKEMWGRMRWDNSGWVNLLILWKIKDGTLNYAHSNTSKI